MRHRRAFRGVLFVRVWPVLTLLPSLPARGAIYQGELPATSDFGVYVGKFCFGAAPNGEDVGRLSVELWGLPEVEVGAEARLAAGGGDAAGEAAGGTAAPPPDLFFLVYDDDKSGWGARVHGRWESMTCREKAQDASVSYSFLMGQEMGTRENQTISFKEKLQPRFWYFAFAACGFAQKAGHVHYRVHVTNARQDFHEEVSLDRAGLGPWYTLLALALGLAAALASRAALRQPVLKEHPYLKLLLLSLCAACAACVLRLVHHCMIVWSGLGWRRLRLLAALAVIVADCSLFLLAILSSTGWAISSAKIPDRQRFLGLAAAVGALEALSELRAELSVDSSFSTPLYGYQSAPGLLAMATRVFIFSWFVYLIRDTYDQDARVALRSFYTYLTVAVAAWSLSCPVAVSFAFAMPPWYRYKVVTMVDLVSRLFAQALLAQLLCGPLSPITQENTFPFRRRAAAQQPDDTPFIHLQDADSAAR